MGSAQAKGASAVDTAKSLQAEHWRNAKEAFARSLTLLQGMKASGTLSATDRGKLDEAAKGIGNSDTALKSLEIAVTAP
jgi:hypothetical protein